MIRGRGKPSKTARKIVDHLKEVGYELPGDPDKWAIERTYCGHVQKSCGAWTFTLEWHGPRENSEALSYSGQVGSQWPASVIAKNGVHSVNQWGGIYPKETP